MTPRPHSRGFTLVELLVALAISGLVAALLLQSLRLGLTGRDRIGAAAHAAEDVEALHRFLRTLVHEMRLEPSYERRGRLVRPFHGTAREMTFSAPDAPAPYEAGLLRHRLVFDTTARALLLVSADDSAGHDDPALARSARRTVLLEGVEDAVLSYLEPAGSGRWLPRWVEEDRLPAAIRLVVAFGEGDDRRWIPFVARTFAAGPAFCDFDPVARGCR